MASLVGAVLRVAFPKNKVVAQFIGVAVEIRRQLGHIIPCYAGQRHDATDL